MGTDRATSAVNRYLQSWDVHNVFVMGASAFPQNIQYNPTGAVTGVGSDARARRSRVTAAD
jgi:gluconate 2-dehydrogenase alpha chain